MAPLTQIPLKNGQILGCLIYEVTAIPEVPETAQATQVLHSNEAMFYNLLTELYRYCIPNTTVL